MARRPLLLLLLLGALAALPAPACGSEGPGAGERARSLALVDPTLWERGPLSDDPLSKHQPESIECDIAGSLVERGELEMNTDRCNYLWLASLP